MDKPVIYMIAGCNGAGKTTLARVLLPDFLHLNVLLNPDDVARGLNPLDPVSMNRKAGEIVLKQMDEYIEQKKSFAFETTASGVAHVKRLKRARTQGFDVHLIYLFLSSPELAILRVENRIAQGGHAVPKADIVRRYHRGIIHILDHYASLATTTKFYLADQYQADLFAIQSADGVDVIDPQVWADFRLRYREEKENAG